jgi:O-antigen/teichoic acid export membrane protein
VNEPTSAPAPGVSSGGFVHNVLRTFATQGLTFPLHALTGIVTARLLGPHDRGLYSLLIMIPATLEILLRLGVGSANVYMLCRQGVKGTHVVSNTLVLAFGLGALAFLLVPFRDAVGHTLLANVDGWFLIIAVSMVPFYLLATYLTSILHALNQFQAVNRQAILAAALRLAATAFVLVVLHRGLFEAFLVTMAVSVLTAGWLLAAVGARTSLAFQPNLAVATGTLKFGLKSHAQSLLTALHLRLDHFLVAFFLGPSQVAFYALATHLAELIGAIDRPVSTVLYPRFAASSEARIHDTTLTVCRHVLLLESLAGLGLILGARFMILALYGRDYLPAAAPLYLIVPGVLALSLFSVLGRNFMSRNKQQTTIVAGLAGLVVNTLLNLALIPALGIKGAALASTISYSLSAFILLVAFRRDAGLPLLELVRVRRSDLEFYRTLAGRFVPRLVAVA